MDQKLTPRRPNSSPKCPKSTHRGPKLNPESPKLTLKGPILNCRAPKSGKNRFLEAQIIPPSPKILNPRCQIGQKLTSRGLKPSPERPKSTLSGQNFNPRDEKITPICIKLNLRGLKYTSRF